MQQQSNEERVEQFHVAGNDQEMPNQLQNQNQKPDQTPQNQTPKNQHQNKKRQKKSSAPAGTSKSSAPAGTPKSSASGASNNKQRQKPRKESKESNFDGLYAGATFQNAPLPSELPLPPFVSSPNKTLASPSKPPPSAPMGIKSPQRGTGHQSESSSFTGSQVSGSFGYSYDPFTSPMMQQQQHHQPQVYPMQMPMPMPMKGFHVHVVQQQPQQQLHHHQQMQMQYQQQQQQQQAQFMAAPSPHGQGGGHGRPPPQFSPVFQQSNAHVRPGLFPNPNIGPQGENLAAMSQNLKNVLGL